MKQNERRHRRLFLFKKAATLMMAALGIPMLLTVAAWAECDKEEYSNQRQKMADRQIAGRGIRNPAVLAAMKTVPRHCFVPERQKRHAYRDGPLPIGHGQTISQPYIVAIMSELLDVKPGESVLEVGTGSGYQAAVLAAMGIDVFTIEIVAPLGERAARTLKELGYETVHTRIGDGYKGWPDQAPFDGIIVTAAPSRIPHPLIEQLAENGRMVIPVGPVRGVQQLLLLRKINGKIKRERIFDVRFVPMVDKKGKGY